MQAVPSPTTQKHGKTVNPTKGSTVLSWWAKGDLNPHVPKDTGT